MYHRHLKSEERDDSLTRDASPNSSDPLSSLSNEAILDIFPVSERNPAPFPSAKTVQVHRLSSISPAKGYSLLSPSSRRRFFFLFTRSHRLPVSPRCPLLSTTTTLSIFHTLPPFTSSSYPPSLNSLRFPSALFPSRRPSSSSFSTRPAPLSPHLVP